MTQDELAYLCDAAYYRRLESEARRDFERHGDIASQFCSRGCGRPAQTQDGRCRICYLREWRISRRNQPTDSAGHNRTKGRATIDPARAGEAESAR